MVFWWVDRVLPGVVSAIIIGTGAYVHLHFNPRWPYWGRTGQATEPEGTGHDGDDTDRAHHID